MFAAFRMGLGPSGSRNAEYMESLLTISYFPYHIAYIIWTI